MSDSLINPQVSNSIIKSLTEAAFVSSSVVAIATTAVPEAPEISPPSASEPSSSSSVSTIIELLFLQLWELCGNCQLPTAAISPLLLLKNRVGWEKVLGWPLVVNFSIKKKKLSKFWFLTLDYSSWDTDLSTTHLHTRSFSNLNLF